MAAAVATVAAGDVSEKRLVELMTGRTIEALYPTIDHQPGRVMLRTEGLTLASGRVHDVSIDVRAGRGRRAGRDWSAPANRRSAAPSSGWSRSRAAPSRSAAKSSPHPTPRGMLDRGVVYIPPDRREEGLVAMRLGAREHVAGRARPARVQPARSSCAAGWKGATVREIAQRLNLRPLNIERQVA